MAKTRKFIGDSGEGGGGGGEERANNVWPKAHQHPLMKQ